MNYDAEAVWRRYQEVLERTAGRDRTGAKLEEFNDLLVARMCRVCPWPIFEAALIFVEATMRTKANGKFQEG